MLNNPMISSDNQLAFSFQNCHIAYGSSPDGPPCLAWSIQSVVEVVSLALPSDTFESEPFGSNSVGELRDTTCSFQAVHFLSLNFLSDRRSDKKLKDKKVVPRSLIRAQRKRRFGFD